MRRYQMPKANVKEVCAICIEGDIEPENYINDNNNQFNSKYCVTECSNNLVPKYLPEEQVIKYLKRVIQ
jgi:hypothetical protein